MFKDKNKSENNDPMHETYLHRPDSGIILDIHNLLQFFVPLLNIAFGISNVEVNPIENSTLFNDQCADIPEQITQIIHLVHDLLYFLLLQQTLILIKLGFSLFYSHLF